MKKKMMALFVLISLISVGNVFAFDPKNDTPKMTDYGEAFDKPEFEWTVTPYAFIQFLNSDVTGPKKTVNYMDLTWTWTHGETGFTATETLSDITILRNSNFYSNWNALDTWDTAKIGRTGDWNVMITWMADGMPTGAKTESFKLNGPVAPEPVSSALFLIGGGVFAAHRRRKKINKATLMMIGFLVFSLICVGSAFADAVPHMTTADGVTTTQPGAPSTYDWEQKPWFYFTLPVNTLTYSVSWWKYSGDSFTTPNLEITDGQSQLWHGLDNWFDLRKSGDWTVRADYSYGTGVGSTGTVNFKVNPAPEPISSALFLLGGTVLAVRQYRKKKRSV